MKRGFLSSNTIQGLLIMAVPFVDQAYQYIQSIPEGLLPKPLAVAVTGLGWALALFGRMNKNVKPIEGII